MQRTVRITIFDKSGQMLTYGFNYENVPRIIPNPSDASVAFVLAPNSTSRIYIYIADVNPVNYGYGRITWESNNTNTQFGVVASIHTQSRLFGVNTFPETSINNGLPF